MSVAGDDIEQLVTVDLATEVIDHQQTVAVAVERDANGGPYARDGELQ